MKRQAIPYCYVALFLCSIFPCQVAAQRQNCAPPVALPVSSEPNIFTEEQEIYLGDAIAEHIQRNYHVIEDPDVTLYLTRIGERLTKHLPLNRLQFQFFLVDMPDANAFVLPGGRIYVSRKLVAAAQTEDELAAVMGHEPGHPVAHQSEDFKQWRSQVIAYNGLGRKEALHGVLSKLQLSPPLRSDIIHLRFSPDGRYLIAQDDSGINVLAREPFAPLFRIEALYDTYYANFTPDSQEIVFYNDNLHVERWSVASMISTRLRSAMNLSFPVRSQCCASVKTAGDCSC